MKLCKSCDTIKDESEFYKNRRMKDGLGCYCKICESKKKTERLRRKSRELGKSPRYYTLDAREDRKNGIKFCPGCKRKRLLTEFSSNKAARDGIASHCLECSRLLSKKHHNPETRHTDYVRNKSRIRNNKLLREFGMTLEEYNLMLYDQDHKCAICGKSEKENKKALAVDHSHITGKVRELLCNNCNAAVGFLQDSPEIARLMVGYLEKHKEVCH